MNRTGILQWMIGAGISQAQIAREARVSPSLVCLVIAGKRKHPLVLTLLRGHGCPEEYLSGKPRTEKAA